MAPWSRNQGVIGIYGHRVKPLQTKMILADRTELECSEEGLSELLIRLLAYPDHVELAYV